MGSHYVPLTLHQSSQIIKRRLVVVIGTSLNVTFFLIFFKNLLSFYIQISKRRYCSVLLQFKESDTICIKGTFHSPQFHTGIIKTPWKGI